jgi:hypothetical protein
MSTDDDSRTRGVEFGPLAEELENEEYPMAKREVVERYGDRELGLEDGDETVREVLEPLGKTTYESPGEVRQGVLNTVGDEAVGREDCSDRGGHTEGVDEGSESESLRTERGGERRGIRDADRFGEPNGPHGAPGEAGRTERATDRDRTDRVTVGGRTVPSPRSAWRPSPGGACTTSGR